MNKPTPRVQMPGRGGGGGGGGEALLTLLIGPFL